MELGFTGTQKGLTPPQFETLCKVMTALRDKGYEWINNGDCIGADDEAFQVWKALGGKSRGHIPEKSNKRAFCEHDENLSPLPYLDRNKKIVDRSSVLIGTPGEMTEQLRSGTWSTIRYAKNKGVTIIIVYPDGSVANV